MKYPVKERGSSHGLNTLSVMERWLFYATVSILNIRKENLMDTCCSNSSLRLPIDIPSRGRIHVQFAIISLIEFSFEHVIVLLLQRRQIGHLERAKQGACGFIGYPLARSLVVDSSSTYVCLRLWVHR